MLIDPSVGALTAAGLPGSLLSFGTPCLKWKLAAAFKTHFGYTGFDGSISPPNRYLTKTVQYIAPPNSATSVFTIDRYSGAVTSDPPGALDIENTPNPGPVTITGDTIATAVSSIPGETQIFVVTLSNPYTIAMLEADVDALLESFDPDTVPGQTITSLSYAADFQPVAGINATELIPAPYNYPALRVNPFNSPTNQPTLGAAAIAAYDPGQFISDFNTAGFGKVIGWLAMAGDYCLKTFTLNNAGQLVGSPTCISGRGSCSSWFKVTPPTPYVLGQNTYILAVPNCQCGN